MGMYNAWASAMPMAVSIFARGAYGESDKGVTRGCYEISFACVRRYMYISLAQPCIWKRNALIVILCSGCDLTFFSTGNHIESESIFFRSLLKSNFILIAFSVDGCLMHTCLSECTNVTFAIRESFHVWKILKKCLFEIRLKERHGKIFFF